MKFEETESAVTLQPEPAASAAVIWLHGLGADGNDFVPIVPELGLDDLAIRYVFPHAPVRPVTINMGMKMRAWYDIPSVRDLKHQDADGIRDSEKILQGYVQKEVDAGIRTERIVLAGFSQGGAIVLHSGLRYPQKLAGILALSTYLPLAEALEVDSGGRRKDTPVFMCHGSQDAVLPMALGEYSRDLLQQQGYAVQWREYPMQHQVCAEEIGEIGGWLRKVLT